MMLYLIKSGLCLGLVALVYKLFLEREKMPQFNRVFLLFGLVFSFVAPLVSLSWGGGEVLPQQAFEMMINNEAKPVVERSLPVFSWTILYAGIAFLLGLRFCYLLQRIATQILAHKQVDYQGSQLVLLEEETLPYTFLNYIFISQTAHEKGEIEPELYTHELAHAQQLHSLDVLIVELFQVLFWANPLLIWYKKAIQLNHEFLADDAVVQKHHDVAAYQHLLVDKIQATNTLALASNLNFLLTKKRLRMMTQKTPKTKVISLGAMAIPLFYGLLLLFSNPVVGQATNEAKLKDAYFEHTTVVRKKKGTNQKMYKPYKALTKEEKASIPMFPEPDGKHNPLPKGTAVYLHDDGRVVIKLPKDGAAIPPPPPPPPAPPAPSTAPKAPSAPVPPAPASSAG